MPSSNTPLRQFGGVSAMMIVYALLACLLIQPALLVLWARRREARGLEAANARADGRAEPALREDDTLEEHLV